MLRLHSVFCGLHKCYTDAKTVYILCNDKGILRLLRYNVFRV